MKKTVTFLLALAATLFLSATLSAEPTLNDGRPDSVRNPIVIGDPSFNPLIPRPGPFTPKQKPKPANKLSMGPYTD